MPNDANKSAYTRSDLKAMQSWPLDKKVRVSQLRIMESITIKRGSDFSAMPTLDELKEGNV